MSLRSLTRNIIIAAPESAGFSFCDRVLNTNMLLSADWNLSAMLFGVKTCVSDGPLSPAGATAGSECQSHWI